MAHDEEQERAFGGQTKTGGLSQIHPYMGGGAPPGICRLRRGSGRVANTAGTGARRGVGGPRKYSSDCCVR